MARANYGAISNDSDRHVAFGQNLQGAGNAGKLEFNQLCETISSNLFTIQSSCSNLERACKSLGTRRDNHGLRDSIRVIQLSVIQVVTQTKQELILLSSTVCKIGDRKLQALYKLQVDRLKNEFENCLQRYSSLQKDVASRMKAILPVHDWEQNNASTASEQENTLEKVAEERHQKLQELKQVEFEQQMLLEREQRINQIESDMIDVNQIMKELSAMVQEQGESINSIEHNIDRAQHNVEEGTRQLEKAASSQRKHRKWLCFLSGLGITIAGVVALVIYLELRPS